MKKRNGVKVMDYRGVEVFMDSGFRFYAHHAGLYHNGGSWETLRKKLDKAVVFEPFDALQITNAGVEQVRVTALDMYDSQWVVERSGHTHGGTRIKFYHTLFPVEMRDELEQFLAECEIWDKVEADNKAARETMREALAAKKLPRPGGDS